MEENQLHARHPHVDTSTEASLLGDNLRSPGKHDHGHTTKTGSGEGESGEFKRSLTFWKLCALTFASVAGGPYGFEESVGAGGAYLTVVGILLMPFFWSVPSAMMTAELATMMPENGGHILWVDRAFGPFWSFLNSYATLYALIFEGGLYPVMFCDYFEELLGVHFPEILRLGLSFTLVIAVAYLNIKGTDIVGDASVGFTIASLGPFLIMIVIGLMTRGISLTEAPEVAPSNVKMVSFVTILLWSTSGYDIVGACAGEVDNPGKTFPKAMAFALTVTTALDCMSMVVGMSVVKNYASWHDGTFMDVAYELGGDTLEAVFTFGAAISVIGLLCTLICSSSRIIYGMAVVGTLPKVFAKTSKRYGTPYMAIIMNSVFVSSVVFLPFEALAEAEMWFYCVSTILKFAALYKLRKDFPDKPRPFKIPLSDERIKYFCLVPCILCVLLIVIAEVRTQIIGAIGLLIAYVAYKAAVAIKGDASNLIAMDELDE
uniref:Amino acid permease/ SLC12A domain-containing protein n=1 Tax=Pyramimonas obovata TaxID=1411642 RepID=A0A7S0RF09_9CHLO|mmetsp:Transcript_32799/g.71551  ORF Transcript_32799/g.71551 Transcript_32799/m.71551 type:complete len:488 (+) Transcript_32799:151-1614(+)